MGRLTAENKSVIFISHKMREVMAVSDRVTILRAGQTITTVDKKDTDGAQLANLMIGHEMTVSAYKKVTEPGEDVLRLLHVDYQKDHKHSGLNNVSFSIGKGEILGVAGVDGNGQSTACAAGNGSYFTRQRRSGIKFPQSCPVCA